MPTALSTRAGSRAAAAVIAVAALVTALLVTVPAGGHAVAADAPTYENPVSKTFADTFADPSVIRGKDGWWYSFGTSDPLREGEGTPHQIPIARSRDLVDWQHLGDAFGTANRPSWATPDAGLWAPDIRYVDGEYRLYYVVTNTTTSSSPDDNAIGVATAPTPHGPWTDSGGPVVGPRTRPDGSYLWTFDPSVVTDRDGSQWVFFGSYNGGVFVQPLDATGRHTTGPEQMVAIDNKFEGAYVVRHGAYWYFFGSTANCCAGPTTGYSVQVGRSTDLRGPYVDRQGTPLLDSRAGGTPTLVQNGNSWIGSGHNAIATDVRGRDFIVYHAIDRADPYLDGTGGINQRPMLLDRLDWVDGWPAVRDGLGPSDTPQPAPVTTSDRTLSATRVGVLSANRRGSVRVEGDLSGAAALVARWSGPSHGVSARIRPDSHELRLVARSGGKRVERTAPLPAGMNLTTLHSVVLQVVGSTAYAALSQARLGDPVAELSIQLPVSLRDGAGRAGALTDGGGTAANVTTAGPAGQPDSVVTEAVPTTAVPSAGDEFNAADLGPGWTWVRPDPTATVAGGELRWPTQAADLVGSANTAAVLLRQPPSGDDWSVATKLSIDLGVDTVRNYQQAGLIVYAGDDDFARLSHVAIWNTRQTEFGRELPWAGGTSYGGTIVGPPAETTYLRLTHHLDPANGEHELRAATSRDGTDWVTGGVWTFPAGTELRVGLISQGRGGADAPATARFDWFRAYH